MRTTRRHIGGEWVDGRPTFDVEDPYDGTLVLRAPAGTREDARRAIDAAAAAFPAWSAAPPAERQRLFLRAADVLERRADGIAAQLTRESGAATSWARFQLGFTPGLLRQAAALAYQPTGEVIPRDLPGAVSLAVRRPVGVVGAITPWNAALILSLRAKHDHALTTVGHAFCRVVAGADAVQAWAPAAVRRDDLVSERG